MAKRGLEYSTVHSILKDIKGNTGWTLCIGAGTSIPAVPDWYTLVERLILNNCDTNHIIDISAYKELGFSADTMIQAVKNQLCVDDQTFMNLLSKELYENIRSSFTTSEWQAFVSIHEKQNVGQISKRQWVIYELIFRTILERTSANSLAKTVIRSIFAGVPPECILTFNGESIFLTLLNYHYHLTDRIQKNLFDHIVNSISSRHRDRIPYIHCHGIIPIDTSAVRKGYIASEKIVFSENNYLQLANSSFSWQSANFIESCLHSRIVFVGVSLTDSNMRKWLSWTHSNKMRELVENGIDCEEPTEHYWIKKTPPTLQEKIGTEESVAHLGIRLIWIEEWEQAGLALGKLLGLK